MSNPINITLTKKIISVVTAGRGLRGYAVEIRVDSGYIQTKYEYETEWTNLIPLSTLIGPQGLASYIHIKWHAEGSEVLLDTPEAYIGIYADNTEADSTIYDDYQWYKTKGDKGDPGNLTGPASSVNENIPIFDGVTGDKLKDSGVKLSDKADVDDVADALALKAPLASPTFTGDVIVPDQAAGNNSTKAANTKYVDAKVAESITNGVTGIAPSQDVVFDALALKADLTYAEYLMMEGDPA